METVEEELFFQVRGYIRRAARFTTG